ncbi:hypothetical protein CYFUS_007029 [Cystobacter fuscus]|uniref:Restriction endonuclease, SacI family n=2 Tax=Cystobacter fuscus TaxID=43 RepID=A0A250JD67_9BACT|nr:hypothetical protein CYFUS_007029 [Cystobacter fuscus]
MQIDKEKALQVLEAEVASTSPSPSNWCKRVEALSLACEHSNKTFIAALGTALLAKSVELSVDPFALKDSSGTRGYSARSLCKDVLAAHAPRLHINLGVRGREPLNNQPFFAEDRISAELPVRASGREPLRLLLEALTALDAITDSQKARAALRAFLLVRKDNTEVHSISKDAGDKLTETTLLRIIQTFVSENSESGKRAQAVAAGLIDTEFGAHRVDVGKIFDPSRKFPGDIIVKDQTDNLITQASNLAQDSASLPYDNPRATLTYEVRDKSVTSEDLYHLARRALDHQVTRAVMLAVANQAPMGAKLNDAIHWSLQRGVRLHMYVGWESFLRDSLFRGRDNTTPGSAYRAIHKRLNQIEVSKEGIKRWVDLATP